MSYHSKMSYHLVNREAQLIHVPQDQITERILWSGSRTQVCVSLWLGNWCFCFSNKLDTYKKTLYINAISWLLLNFFIFNFPLWSWWQYNITTNGDITVCKKINSVPWQNSQIETSWEIYYCVILINIDVDTSKKIWGIYFSVFSKEVLLISGTALLSGFQSSQGALKSTE